MNKNSVSVLGLSKIYRIYSSPREMIREFLWGRPAHTPFYALEDVTFEVRQGGAFGVIGENGAGKSTLLKILTGTAFPTRGTVQVDGRVSALLELGAGFHPELSGRQNIYFTGALMALERAEIRSREEEIIAFSELEKFIDHPVRTYSSGMYVRLGFAIATGFEPDVLIIDEALSVGDPRFQKKCTDRILEFKRNGATILFCSHNLYQVQTLCDEALWLSEGRVQGLGRARDVIEDFNQSLQEEARPHSDPVLPSPVCRIESVELRDGQDCRPAELATGEDIRLEITADFAPDFKGTPAVGVSLVRQDGVAVYTTTSTMEGVPLRTLEGHRYVCRITYPKLPLLAGSYYFNVFLTDQENLQAYHGIEKAAAFTIRHNGPDYGIVRIPHHWD